jgi:hypothetical protein
MMDSFERKLTPEQQADPRFAYRVFMVHRTAIARPVRTSPSNWSRQVRI